MNSRSKGSSRKKLIWRIGIGLVLLMILGLFGIGNYFYEYAFVPGDKDFISQGSAASTEKEQAAEQWYQDSENRQAWSLTSEDNLNLQALFYQNNASEKTVIIAHGYMGSKEDMADYAQMFYQLGYNVLVPDARGHGESQGDYVGFGWDERKDMQQWIAEVLTQLGSTQEIVLFGVSMGGATVMMTSGEDLPDNVVAIIEDCGYASVREELSYQLKQLFNLPAFPIIPVTNLVTKVRAGYFFSQADATKQLAKNTRPILFIHGTEDSFVPLSMLAQVYSATSAPKEKYEVAGAEHAASFSVDPEMYQTRITAFLNQYVGQ